MEGDWHAGPVPKAEPSPFDGRDVRADGPVSPLLERDILAEAQELVQVGAWQWDVPSGDVWWSSQVFQILGVDPQTVSASFDTLLAATHPDDREALLERSSAALAGTGDYDLRHRVVWANGEIRYVHERSKVVRGPDGGVRRVLGMVIDVTEATVLQQERDAAVEALVESERRYRLLAENATDVVFSATPDGTIDWVSEGITVLLGWPVDQVERRSGLDFVDPRDRDRTADAVAQARPGQPTALRARVTHVSGDARWMRCRLTPVGDGGGGILRYVGGLRDVDAEVRAEEALTRQAQTDQLTGLLNRAEGLRRLRQTITGSRHGGPWVAVAFCDLDGFKAANDTYGHAAGDRLLVAAATRIRACVRADDLVARVGGDELLVVFEGVHDPGEAVALAEKVRAGVARPLRVGDRELAVTISVGVTLAGAGEDIDTVIVRADNAMYRAKAAGRNQVVWLDPPGGVE